VTAPCRTQRLQPNLAFGPPGNHQFINWVPALIALAVFTFDLLTPRGLIASALYVLAPAACLWVPHAVMSSRMVLITSALAVMAYFFDADVGVPAWICVTNTVIALILVWSVTWMVGLRNRRYSETAGLATQVHGLRERAAAAEAAVCAEVSRQLHEGLGQELAALGWASDRIAKQAGDAKRVEAAAGELRERISLAQETLRGMALRLRKRSVDRSAIPRETRAHIEWFGRQTGIQSAVHGEELLLRLSPEGAICAFHFVQEALANVAKHAQATHAQVEIIGARDGWIHIAVSDDGRGIAPADRVKPASLGLIGLEERLLALGGSLRVESIAPRGTRVLAQMPGSEAP
jgi:signal transduction histidine kinase